MKIYSIDKSPMTRPLSHDKPAFPMYIDQPLITAPVIIPNANDLKANFFVFICS
jgi:hypothetical protein